MEEEKECRDIRCIFREKIVIMKEKLKTIAEWGFTEEQAMQMGMSDDYQVILAEDSKIPWREFTFTVYPDEECRDSENPFELLEVGAHEDDIVYANWEKLQTLYLSSVHKRQYDIEYLKTVLDEDAALSFPEEG